MAEIINIIRQLEIPGLDYEKFMLSLCQLLRFCSDCAKGNKAADKETLDLIRAEIASCGQQAGHDREESMDDYYEEFALSNLLGTIDPEVSKKELEDVLGKERMMNLVDREKLAESKEARSVEDFKIIILAEHLSDTEELLKSNVGTVFGEIGGLVLDMLKRRMEAWQAEVDFLSEDIQNRETVLVWWAAKESL